MGSWGVGNFENDGARDFIGDLMDDLAARIHELFASGEVYSTYGGEGVLVPSIEVMSVLSEKFYAIPPELEIIDDWQQRYLEYFDSDEQDGWKGELAIARRRNISSAFDMLKKHSENLNHGHGDERLSPKGNMSRQDCFSVGSIVVHPKFGRGIILELDNLDGGTSAKIDFQNHGEKWLVIEFANLRFEQ